MAWTAPEITRDEFPLDLPERAALEAFLRFHRQTVLWKVAGLTGEQLALRPVPSTTMSLLGLLRHLAEVEHHWWFRRVSGADVPHLYEREGDEDWNELDPARAAADYQQLLDVWAAVDQVAGGHGLDDTFRRRDETWTVRALYLHLIEEYARHNGHADLLREAIDGAVGE
ncbi:MAG: DinB family protein [Propionicimonas sp.]|nr:DinB family protein [Propionicimonas sp.]